VLLEPDRFSRSSTHCTVWFTAASAFVTACDGVLFKSFWTVEKADCAVDRSPELIALPRDFISVASWEPEDELLPLVDQRFWFSWSYALNAVCAADRFPEARFCWSDCQAF
jgi:hypothetical protein